MARSRETFGKKENEKKKVKKKQDKQEKKEARKANSSNGNDLDDMLAYVDEFGNITSTPPDPLKKKEKIKLEDIQIGISKQEDREPEPTTRKGSVTFFNESKGFGFIKDKDSQESIFFHIKGLIDPVKDRDRVVFEVELTPKGKNAVDVKLDK